MPMSTLLTPKGRWLVRRLLQLDHEAFSNPADQSEDMLARRVLALATAGREWREASALGRQPWETLH
jgi:hypothetical protein